MAKLIQDFGNARIKFFEPRKRFYDDCRHAIALLDESDWRRVVGRGKPPKGMLKVNGQAVAIGDAARRYVIADRPKGASRYRKEYYGIGLGYALSEAFQKDMGNVELIASHAPLDIDYAKNLRAAALGIWQIESRFGSLTFNIREVKTFDEPLGGYSHYVFTETGDERKKNPLRESTTLVVDIGGHTVDVAAVDPGGEIDLVSLNSKRVGVIGMTSDFENYLRSNNPTLFQNTGDLDIKRVESAILTGIYKFGNTTIDCSAEALAVKNALVNDVIQVMDGAGGAGNYDFVLLTGGGSALVFNELKLNYPRIEFLLAEPERDLMKYANVFGGAKLAIILENVGVW